MGGERDASGTAKPTLREHCPICGKLIREDNDYYRCPKCKKDFVCPADYDTNYRACMECAGTLEERVERAEVRAQRAEEDLAQLCSQTTELENHLRAAQQKAVEVAKDLEARAKQAEARTQRAEEALA